MSHRFARALRGLIGPSFKCREDLEDYQSICLRQLVEHAYNKVPYYKRRFDEAGISPRLIRGLDDLHLIPITQRADLQMLAAEDVCANGYTDRIDRVATTSGSSGSPLTVRRTRLEENLMLAYRAKAVGALGFGPRSRRANIDHFSPDSLIREAQPMFYEKLGIMPRLNLDWRLPSNELIESIINFKADLISGPPSLLADLADTLDDRHRAKIGARYIVTGAEQLFDAMRCRIEHGFRLPVADIFGCTETVFIAMKSPNKKGYQLCEEAVLVEVLDQGKPASRGEIYITGLHLWSMPFIRYRLGDQVEEMERTEQHRYLRSIDGRTTDRFRLPDGSLLHGYSLGEIIENSSLRVRQFQIVQLQLSQFEIRLVLENENQTALTNLKKNLHQKLGPSIDIDIKVLPSIARPDRKFHAFVSYQSPIN